MVTVGGLLASAVIKMAGDKLGSAIAEQASLVWNVREHMEDMKNTLETIKAVLKDAERRSIREELVRLWLKRLKNAAYDISDMLDKFQDMSTQQQMTGIIPIAVRKISQGNKMKKMREKLRKIEAEHTSFNFMQNTITICDQQSYDPRETASEDVNESEIIGRDADKLRLVGLLSSCCDTEAMILPIYGLGGIGKSTLAGLVYNDTQFKGYHRVWVYVSQMFDPIKIGNSIISQLSTVRKKKTNSRELISQCLDDLLSDKKVLVVLDDLWEDNESELNKLKTMLRSRKGSTIYVIVTTRRAEIASKVCTDNCKPYQLKPLKKDICWGIIKRYSQFEKKANKERLQPIGLSIAEKCGGVALAAQALGRTLKRIEDIHGWSEIDNSDIWNNENPLGTEVLPSLQLSYERMLPTLRLCFSYCAIFSKGHDIVEADLIHQWAAMDFVQQPSKGKQYIKELLGMSFLQHSKLPSTSQEHVVRYTMHDLVHDLARLTMQDELIVFDVAPQKKTRDHKYCRYSLLRKYNQTMKLANMPSKLRALHFSDSGELDVPSGAFSFAKCLRTLDFSECSGIMLPDSIGRMKQLRCLIAPRMKNDSLRECITELSKLQYLNISGSSKITELSRSIGKLGCLRYLCLSSCSGISKLAESFGDLKCMMHLDLSGCSGLIELPDSIGNLTQLQHLELSACSSLKALPESLCGLTQLQTLDLSSCSRLKGLPVGVGSLVGVQHLYMLDCEEIKELPKSFGDLKCMVHLDISGCSRLIELPDSIGKLTHLQHLQLSGCSSLIALPESLCGLTQLQTLDLSSCSSLKGLPVGVGSLVGVQHLYMSYCEEIRELPESFGGLKCMVHLDISCCSELTELPDSIGNLTHLQHLDLSRCSSLTALPESLCCLTQLQYLNVSSCSYLEGLPIGIGNLVGIQHLYMSDCYEIRELPESLVKLQRLSHLNLSGCNRMHCYRDLSDNLGTLSNNLKYLKLSMNTWNCYDFIGAFGNLEHLDLSWNNCLEYLPESIGNLKRLHTLDLSYCCELKSLPGSIGRLGLKSLLLEGCSDVLINQASSMVNYLQTLPVFKVRVDEVNGCSSLHLLEGINVSELRIFSIENVRSLEEATKVKLSDKDNLTDLRLEWSTIRSVQFVDDQDLLGQLVPPRGLKRMYLRGYSCTSFPGWLMCIYSHLPNLVSIELFNMPTCSNLPPLGQLPHLENLWLSNLPAIKRIDKEFCGGKGAFHRLSYLVVYNMDGLEEWNTTYSVEEGVEEFMFPVLEYLKIEHCPRLRLKPCPPIFRECTITWSNQVISSLEDAVDKISQISLPYRHAIKLKLHIQNGSCQSIRIFHHFPALQELCIQGKELKSLPESMRHLTSLESLTLFACDSISALPEWLGDLSSLKSLYLSYGGIKSLPACIQHLTKLERLKIQHNQELKEWCKSEENKAKLAHINIIKLER